MSEISNTKNIKRLTTPVTYMLGSEDDVLDIDTTGGVANIYLPNILQSGLLLIRKRIYINDVGNNAGVNNINVITLGGDKINNGASLQLADNGISAEISVANRTEYIANLSTDSGSGSTITGANNGLGVAGTVIQLGGALIQPTIITASNVNYFDVQDSWGSLIKTRDANANFSMVDFGGNSYFGTNLYTFSYLALGNTYDNCIALLNFGSINSYTTAIDTWNFGDYGTFDNSNVTFNFGRNNSFTSTYGASVFGNFNVIDSVATTRVIGDSNFLNTNNAFVFGSSVNLFGGGSDAFVVGTGVNFTGSGGYIYGFNVSVDGTNTAYGNGNIFSFGHSFSIFGGSSVDSIVNIGFANSISATSETRWVYILGDSHVCNDFVTYSTLIGESCTFTRVDHSTALGIFTSLTDVTLVYTFGEGNLIDGSVSITNFGTYNNISSSSNLTVVGNGNTISDSDKLYLGNNNKNVVVDGITGYLGVGITSPLHPIHLFTMVDYPTSQKIHNGSDQSFASAMLEFENNLGSQGWIGIPCEYYGFGWFDNSAIIGDLTINAEQDIVFLTGVAGGLPIANTERARVTSAGNFGIGEIAPTALLTVGNDTANDNTFSVVQKSFASPIIVDIYNNNFTKLPLRITDDGTAGHVLIGASFVDFNMYSENIGVGVVAGASRFLVKGNVAGQDVLSVTPLGGAGGVYVRDVATEPQFYMRDSTALTTISIMAVGDSYFNGGNFGVGITAPTARTHIFGNVNVADYAVKTESGAIVGNLFSVRNDGQINMANLPLSAVGLIAGDLWNDAGVVKIV